MDWFKRYGIPGTYFVSFTIAWIYAFYKCWPFALDIKEIATLGGAIFLPAGYIISNCQQLLYLIIPWMGVHRGAAERLRRIIPDRNFFAGGIPREYIVEALAALLCTSTPLDDRKFIQSSIQKRSDVMTINGSIITASLSAIIVALVIGRVFNYNPQPNRNVIFTLSIISVLIHLVMCLNWLVFYERTVLMITKEFIDFVSYNTLGGPSTIAFPIVVNNELWNNELFSNSWRILVTAILSLSPLISFIIWI